VIDIVNDIVMPAWRRGRKTRRSPQGWISGNCPCCYLHGQSNDKRGRGGLLLTDTGFSYSCFNCGHTAVFKIGKPLGYKARQLLVALGLDQSDLALINLESLRQQDIADELLSRVEKPRNTGSLFWDTIEPPPGELLDPQNPDHKLYADYLKSRSLDPIGYPYIIDLNSDRPGITIPYTYRGKLVGYTRRCFDSKKAKYENCTGMRPGYVFGVDLQKPEWSFALVVEGPFCALSLNGLSVQHQVASPEQCQLLESLEKDLIVVPDYDESGVELVDQAIEQGWQVSMPPWEKGIKDVNDAVCKYGRLGTLKAILDYRESNSLKIKLRRRWFVKRIQS
jgi:hypothetical protein